MENLNIQRLKSKAHLKVESGRIVGKVVVEL